MVVKTRRRPAERSTLTLVPRSALHSEEKYITEEGAEKECGLPRELMQCWAALEVFVPTSPLDRRIRRHVLLSFYCKEKGIAKAFQFAKANKRYPQGRPLILKALVDDIDIAANQEIQTRCDRAKLTDKMKNNLHLYKVLFCLYLLTEPDGLMENVLFADAMKRKPSQADVNAEWDRYYGR